MLRIRYTYVTHTHKWIFALRVGFSPFPCCCLSGGYIWYVYIHTCKYIHGSIKGMHDGIKKVIGVFILSTLASACSLSVIIAYRYCPHLSKVPDMLSSLSNADDLQAQQADCLSTRPWRTNPSYAFPTGLVRKKLSFTLHVRIQTTEEARLHPDPSCTDPNHWWSQASPQKHGSELPHSLYLIYFFCFILMSNYFK